MCSEETIATRYIGRVQRNAPGRPTLTNVTRKMATYGRHVTAHRLCHLHRRVSHAATGADDRDRHELAGFQLFVAKTLHHCECLNRKARRFSKSQKSGCPASRSRCGPGSAPPPRTQQGRRMGSLRRRTDLELTTTPELAKSAPFPLRGAMRAHRKKGTLFGSRSTMLHPPARIFTTTCPGAHFGAEVGSGRSLRNLTPVGAVLSYCDSYTAAFISHTTVWQGTRTINI